MISRERLRQGEKRGRKRIALWRLTSEDRERFWRRRRKTTKRCSCDMCGNPRKHYSQPTRQEISNLAKLLESIHARMADVTEEEAREAIDTEDL